MHLLESNASYSLIRLNMERLLCDIHTHVEGEVM